MRSRILITSLLCLLVSVHLGARVPGRGATTATTGDSGSVDISNPTIGVSGTVISAGTGSSCDPKDTKGYVGLNFIRNIVDPSIPSPNELKVIEVSEGNYKVEVPKYIKACTDLQFEVTKADNNYFVRVKNNYEFTPQNVAVGADESFQNLSVDEKYYRCVEGKGLLKNGSFDRVKAEQVGEISYGLSSNPFAVDYGDRSKSVSVYFGSAKATSYGVAWEAGNVSPKPSGWSCVVYENLGENTQRLYTSVKDSVYDRALRVCETESAEQILEELSRLKDSNAGNFRDLKKILEQAFEKAQGKRVEEIYARMTEIEDAMKPGASGEMISESLAQEYAKEYSALSKEISRIVIQPSTQRVADLLEIRNESNKAEIDKEVKELNDKVQEFSKRNFDKLGFVYDVLKEYALTDEARDIEGLRLASHHYGRVYKGTEDSRGKPMSLKDATDRVQNLIRSFEDNRLKDWEASYATKRGSKAPIQAAIREMRERKSRMDSDYSRFQRTEQQNAQKYCGHNMIGQVKNPVRCRSWMAGRDRRQRAVLNRRSRDLTYLRTQTDRYSTYMTNYEEFQQRQIESQNNSDPFQFYGGTNFNTDYDIYGNPNDYSDDLSWMYSMQNPMGGQQNPMMRQPAGQSQFFAPGFNQPGMMQQPMNQGFMSQPNPFAQPMF
ncbi:MAG: hypothetical protein K9K67_02050 [Bacteriovoracaceae bacterium]|nr:hypothetical protein [Bacteriovoracaceae bacterium]